MHMHRESVGDERRTARRQERPRERLGASPTEFLAEQIRQAGSPLSLDAGRTLFTEGQCDERVFLLESGSIDISICSDEGQRLTLNVLDVGDVFGEVAMLDGGPRTADAIARVDSRLRYLDRRRYFALSPNESEAHEHMVLLLCRRLRWTNRHTEHGVLRPASMRLASRLLMLGEGDADGWIQVSQQDLSDMAATVREYVNQLLRKWERMQIIECRRGAVRITRRELLRELSGGLAPDDDGGNAVPRA